MVVYAFVMYQHVRDENKQKAFCDNIQYKGILKRRYKNYIGFTNRGHGHDDIITEHNFAAKMSILGLLLLLFTISKQQEETQGHNRSTFDDL